MRKEHFPILIIVTALFISFIATLLVIRYYSDSQQILNEIPNSTYNAGIVTDGRLDINAASQEQLSMLPGIGDKLSQRIIEYREENGPFEKVTDLKNVKGIGNKLFDNISDYITVGD